MNLEQFVAWCDALPVSAAIRESLWAFAVIEAVHLLGLALIGGVVLAVDLSLLGFPIFGRPVEALARDTEPWLVGSLVVMLTTGVALFLSEATKCYQSTPFWWKISLLFLAIIFTFTLRRQFIRREFVLVWPFAGKFVASVSLALWFGVGMGGRWIGFSAG